MLVCSENTEMSVTVMRDAERQERKGLSSFPWPYYRLMRTCEYWKMTVMLQAAPNAALSTIVYNLVLCV